MRDKCSDREVDFRYENTQGVHRRKEVDSSDGAYNACGSQRLVIVDTEVRYRRNYHGQGYSYSSAEAHVSYTESSDSYCDRFNRKYRAEEECVEDGSDLCHGGSHRYTKMRQGGHHHTEANNCETSSYSYEDAREQSYKNYQREDDQHNKGARKSASEYDDRRESDDTYHRSQERSDREGHLYYRKQRVDDGYVQHQSSEHYMDRRKSPVESFGEHGLHRTDTAPTQYVDRYSSEYEPHVYRNVAYEGDDVRGSEDFSLAQTSQREERSSGSHFHYRKQTSSDDSLSYCGSERYVDKTRSSSEDIVEDHRGDWQSTDMEFAQPNQGSARKRHGKGLPKLAVTPERAAREGTAVPKRTPLTPTTFSPNGDPKEGLLEIPRCAESGRQQRGGPGRRAGSLVAEGSQRFATMKNARRIAEEMGMEEARAEARVEEEREEECLKEYGGRIMRTSWAKRYAEIVLPARILSMT